MENTIPKYMKPPAPGKGSRESPLPPSSSKDWIEDLDPASLFGTGCLLPTAFQIQILEPDYCLPLAREC